MIFFLVPARPVLRQGLQQLVHGPDSPGFGPHGQGYPHPPPLPLGPPADVACGGGRSHGSPPSLP